MRCGSYRGCNRVGFAMADMDMSRLPRSVEELYQWHRSALAGEKPPVWEGEPQCGWYVRSFSDRGLFYPAMIFMEQDVDLMTGELLSDERMRCIVARPGDEWGSVAGHESDPLEEWLYLAKRPIAQAEYHILMQQVLFSDKYIGPSRPFIRWFDDKEIAGDWFRYQGATNAIRTN